MHRWKRLAAGTALAAIACLTVAYLNRDFPEGTYVQFDPSEREPTWLEVLDPLDPFLWLGAGIALALVSVVIFILARTGGAGQRT